VDLADLGQSPIQNRILHCKSSITYQIHPFFFRKQEQITNPPRPKTQIEPSNSNHSASKPENQPHPEMPIQLDPAIKTKI
jgi:hypothetical protein